MDLKSLQSYLMKYGEMSKSVDLSQMGLKRTRSQGPLKLVIDVDSCLDRLYGGFYPDWVCGGQWDKMASFLESFFGVGVESNLEFTLFFNGTCEERREEEWRKREEKCHLVIKTINEHINEKKRPPPKTMWTPPPFLKSALRIAARSLNISMKVSVEDHVKEVLGSLVSHSSFNGLLLSDEFEFLVYNPPSLYLSSSLKLTYRPSLSVTSLSLDNLFKKIGISSKHFYLMASLLPSCLLTPGDAKCLHTKLGIESSDPDEFIKSVSALINSFEGSNDHWEILTKVYEKIRENSKEDDDESESETEVLINIQEKLQNCLEYYGTLLITPKKFQKSDKNIDESEEETKNCKTETSSEAEPSSSGATNSNSESPPSTSAKKESVVISSYRVSHQIEKVALNRHRSGLMSPYVLQILKHREVRLRSVVEDLSSSVGVISLFRPMRQNVYSILFNLHHLKFISKGEEVKIEVKETVYDPKTKKTSAQMVSAVALSWRVPTVEKLWLGDGADFKQKRVKAFLTILKSDVDVFLDSSLIPHHLLILSALLRYLVVVKKVIRSYELDAFIAQGLITKLTDKDVAQDIELTHMSMRSVGLGQMLMEGVEMALLANDACGSPIPYYLFSPSSFFNGKIFNYVNGELASGRSLQDACGYKMEILVNIDRIRGALLSGIRPNFAPTNFQNVPVGHRRNIGEYERGLEPLYRIRNHNLVPRSPHPLSQTHLSLSLDTKMKQSKVGGGKKNNSGKKKSILKKSEEESAREARAKKGKGVSFKKDEELTLVVPIESRNGAVEEESPTAEPVLESEVETNC